MSKKTAIEKLEDAIGKIDNDPHTKFVNGSKFIAAYTELEAVRSELAALTAQLDAARQRIVTLEGELSDRNALIAGLTADVDGLREERKRLVELIKKLVDLIDYSMLPAPEEWEPYSEARKLLARGQK